MRSLTTLADVERIGFVFTLKHLEAYKSSFLGSRMPEEMGLTKPCLQNGLEEKETLILTVMLP